MLILSSYCMLLTYSSHSNLQGRALQYKSSRRLFFPLETHFNQVMKIFNSGVLYKEKY